MKIFHQFWNFKKWIILLLICIPKVSMEPFVTKGVFASRSGHFPINKKNKFQATSMVSYINIWQSFYLEDRFYIDFQMQII